MCQRNQLTNLFLLLVMKTYSFRNTDYSPLFIPASEEYSELMFLSYCAFTHLDIVQHGVCLFLRLFYTHSHEAMVDQFCSLE